MLPAPVHWYGGKGHLREFILPHIERHGRIYVEPFCGSANLFFAKVPHPVEVLNDLNGDIVNFFRVMQHRRLFRKFAWRLQWTPYAVEEFDAAINLPDSNTDPLDRAWAFFVKHNLGFSGKGDSRGNWRRSFVAAPFVVDDWRNRVSYLTAWRDRLLHAQIDQRDALEILEYWDTEDTLFYLDPPYVEDTRNSLDVYSHEMSRLDHLRLVDKLLRVKGRVVLSGYTCPPYVRLEEAGWTRLDRSILSSMARTGTRDGERLQRIESLWLNRPHEQRLWD